MSFLFHDTHIIHYNYTHSSVGLVPTILRSPVSCFHTVTLKPTWSLTHTVTHTLTHHSLYKSSVKVENNNTVHIKYLILIVAQLSNS